MAVFDTSQNETRLVAIDPALYWNGGVLPDDEPENSNGRMGVGVGVSTAGIFSGPFHDGPGLYGRVLVSPQA